MYCDVAGQLGMLDMNNGNDDVQADDDIEMVEHANGMVFISNFIPIRSVM